MQQVLVISGKAKHVFKYMKLMNRRKSNVTLKELAKANKTFKLDLRS